MRPMLATAATAVPAGPAWVHEVKWDGMRVLADVHDGRLTLTSRTERDVTVAFPELAPLAQEYADLLLDGEIVTFVDGRPSFRALADRFHVTSATRAARLAAAAPVTLVAFDLLRLFGEDLTGAPWSARRELLERLDLDGPRWQVPPTHDDGPVLFAATADQGLEGVVSKRRDSRYLPGRRSTDWRKCPHRRTWSVVIGGWRQETDSTSRLGALLVGVPDGHGGWAYAGKVGSGLAGSVGQALLAELRPLGRDTTPFSTAVPAIDARGAHWLHPHLVADIEALGRTEDGRFRQPAYKGLRELAPEDLQGDAQEDGRGRVD